MRSSGVAIGLRIEAGALTLAVDELLDLDLVGVAQRAGREPARVANDAPTSPNRSDRRPDRVVFRICEQHDSPQHRSPHPARGVPPPAQRGPRRRSCSSRSSRGGSAATRSSAAATASSRSPRPKRSTSRSSATSATTTSRRSSRPCRCPTTAGDCRRAGSSWPTCSSASTTAARSPRCCRRPGRRSPRCSREPCRRSRPSRPGSAARRGASPSPADYERGVERCKEHIRAGDAFQIVLSQRAERRTGGLGALDLPLAAPRQPVAVPLPARARRHRARRLVAGDARPARRARARR